jgi:hypothetical protein
MVWMYDRTQSLLVAVLMHASLTACTFILGPAVVAGSTGVLYGVALAVAWWLVVVAVLVADQRHVMHQKGARGGAGMPRRFRQRRGVTMLPIIPYC